MLETILTISLSLIAFIILILSISTAVKVGVEQGLKKVLLELIDDKEFEFKIIKE